MINSRSIIVEMVKNERKRKQYKISEIHKFCREVTPFCAIPSIKQYGYEFLGVCELESVILWCLYASEHFSYSGFGVKIIIEKDKYYTIRILPNTEDIVEIIMEV